MTSIVGYARGSTSNQSLAQQHDALTAAGLRESGEPISDLVRSFGVSRASIYRALQSAELMALALPSDATAATVVA